MEVARHERLIAKGGCRLELDHYLEALVRKPGALPGATALDTTRGLAAGAWGAPAAWGRLVKADSMGRMQRPTLLVTGRGSPRRFRRR